MFEDIQSLIWRNTFHLGLISCSLHVDNYPLSWNWLTLTYIIYNHFICPLPGLNMATLVWTDILSTYSGFRGDLGLHTDRREQPMSHVYFFFRRFVGTTVFFCKDCFFSVKKLICSIFFSANRMVRLSLRLVCISKIKNCFLFQSVFRKDGFIRNVSSFLFYSPNWSGRVRWRRIVNFHHLAGAAMGSYMSKGDRNKLASLNLPGVLDSYVGENP